MNPVFKAFSWKGIGMEQIKSLFENALKKIENTDINKLDIQPSTNSRFGDLQTNVAMQHAKLLRKSPMQIAEDIIQNLPEQSLISKVEVAPPGFINITLSDEFLNQCLLNLSQDVHFGIPQKENQPHVVIDYSSPNVAKTMHIAHLRSTIIGDALNRILSACGYKVTADNHMGDWGTQFGKLLYAYKNFPHPEDKQGISMLEFLYQEFVRQAEESPELDELARTELVHLQKKEEPNYSLWQEFIQISLKEFHKVYDRLDIHFDTEHGESFYNDNLPSVIDSLKEKNLAKESDGAQVVFFENDELPPFLVQKKNGSFLYATTDLATVRYRLDTYEPHRILYVTDNRQNLHFKQVFKVAELMGYECSFEHIAFGMMRFEEGTVMSTRKGHVIALKDFLDEAETRAYQKIQDMNYSEEEKKEIARVVGLGAVKYQDLSQNPASDITFSWDKALSMEGNSAPYLQYAYARVQGLFRKYEEKFQEKPQLENFSISHPLEKELALHLLQFGSVVNAACNTCKPNLIAEYIYQLASKFASFYNQVPILKEENKELINHRLTLTALCARIIKAGLGLLGIETLERM
jgi:arginyl-tRNA synthetase